MRPRALPEAIAPRGVVVVTARIPRGGLEERMRRRAIRDLGDAERMRVARLTRPEDRDRTLLAHATLRAELAERMRVRTAEVALGRRCVLCGSSEHGAPVVLGQASPSWHVSLAHSGRHVAVALARHPVGVDVETRRPLTDWLDAADTAFAAGEVERAAALRADDDAALGALWSAKEAAVKAWGIGLAVDPRAIVPLGLVLRPSGGRSLTGRATVSPSDEVLAIVPDAEPLDLRLAVRPDQTLAVAAARP